MPKYRLEVPGKQLEFELTQGCILGRDGEPIKTMVYAQYQSLLHMAEIPEGFCPLSQLVKITPLPDNDTGKVRVPESKVRRITRDRYLTAEEAERRAAVIRQIERDLSDLMDQHRDRIEQLKQRLEETMGLRDLAENDEATRATG